VIDECNMRIASVECYGQRTIAVPYLERFRPWRRFINHILHVTWPR